MPDSGYAPLMKKALPKTIRQYVDKKADNAEPYYVVIALDTAGNRVSSFPLMSALIDTLPPAPPTGLRGSVDTAGVVRLVWNRNRERNVLGYRVLRANAPEHEFTQLTGEVWRDTAYTDTVSMQTLTRSVFYKVAAVNVRYNHSRPSALLALRRPNTTPPEAPVFVDVRASDSSVTLQWASSGSEDVQAHVLFRRTGAKDAWVQIASLPRTASLYVDKAVTQSVMYEYLVVAVDSSGLRSPAKLTVQGRPYDTGVRNTVHGLSGTFNGVDNTIVLKWSYTPPHGEKTYYLIFRSRNNAPLSRFRSVESTSGEFVDRDVAGPATYEYAVKVMTQGGAESPISDRARVQISQPGR
jgi:uncharacterized protein